MRDNPAIIQQQPADEQRMAAAIMATWAEYQQADNKRTAKGLDFGKACYELREQTKAQGSRDGSGFQAALVKANIPKQTAYRWIGRYEESAGLRTTWDEVALGGIVPSDDISIIGYFGRVLVAIDPSDHPGFFYVTCFEWEESRDAGGIVEALDRPIRKDFVLSVVATCLGRVNGHVTADMMQWKSTPAKGLNYNHWVHDYAGQYWKEKKIGVA